ncbi:MAG: tetratricopeptide repeat protein [Hespellia sp.]|nr:tetratricopeptide repeat protein [Hespellia sp.]
MQITTKILFQSNYWYNDGLSKAQMHDMSGAITSLRRSLQYNRENIAARNLLGLVYYGRGEVAEGLVEWIISKNFRPTDNIANYYIAKVQENANELEAVNQAVKKYNQCLLYCQQDGDDLAVIQLKKVIVAHPTFLKAYQLLALLYLKTEQYAKARQILRTARKLDTTNEITLRYMHEMTQLKGKKIRETEVRGTAENAVSYKLGNETIIQPAPAKWRELVGQMWINIILGIVIGAATVWFLIVPAVNESQLDNANKQLLEYGELVAAQKAELSAQKKALDEYRASNGETEEVLTNAQNTADSYESLMQVSDQYDSADYSSATMADSLMAIHRDSLGTQGQALFDELTGNIYPDVCDTEFSTGESALSSGDYQTAIDAMNKVVTMNESYQDGEAIYNLGAAYFLNGDTTNANTRFQRVIELYPDTDVATKAQEGLNGNVNITNASSGSGNSSSNNSDSQDESSDNYDEDTE